MATPADPITIRPAYPDDAVALARLAALDSQAVPVGEVVVAEHDGALVAALPVAGGPVLADPFVRTAHVVELLRTHACALGGRPCARRRLAARFGRRPVVVAAAR